MADKEVNHLDNIFHAMGELKTFTIRQMLLMVIVTFPASYQLLSNVFICRNVPHRCASARNDSSQLLSGLGGYRYENLNISYHQCQIVVSYNDTVLKTEECIYGMNYDQPRDTSVVSQFDLVCGYSYLARLSQTCVIAGQGVGAFFFTILSDRYGRKPILVLSNFGLLVTGLIIAYAPTYTVFAIFKFCAGACQQGCLTAMLTSSLEMLTTKNRRIIAAWSGIVWGVSAMSLSLWAYVFRNNSWRTLQMALSMASVPFIIQFLYLKESLRWLIANGKSQAVIDYLRYATKLNKTSFENTKMAYDQTCHISEEEPEVDLKTTAMVSTSAQTKKLTLLDILKVKRLFLNAAIMWLAWFTTALTFFAVYMSSTTLAGNPYLNFFLTALMEVPNNFVLFFLLNKIGRKFTFNCVFIVVIVGVIVTGVFRSLEENTLNSVMTLIFSCVAMSGASSAFAILFFYTKEIFPTNVRNQALGVSSMMGRVGGMLAPFTGILSEKAKWAPGALIGCLAFFVCLLSIFLPETRGRELPQTIDDVKAWFSKSKKNAESTNRNIDTKLSTPI